MSLEELYPIFAIPSCPVETLAQYVGDRLKLKGKLQDPAVYYGKLMSHIAKLLQDMGDMGKRRQYKNIYVATTVLLTVRNVVVHRGAIVKEYFQENVMKAIKAYGGLFGEETEAHKLALGIVMTLNKALGKDDQPSILPICQSITKAVKLPTPEVINVPNVNGSIEMPSSAFVAYYKANHKEAMKGRKVKILDGKYAGTEAYMASWSGTITYFKTEDGVKFGLSNDRTIEIVV